MIPIYRDVDRISLIADKSNRHTANLFGIIAYTDANPNVKKVLKDRDYWDSFHVKSVGWIVYAIRPEYGQHVTYFTDGNGNSTSRRSFEWSYDFLQDFGISQDESFPVFIISCLAEGDSIQSVHFPINDSSVDKAYESISNIIETSTKVISRIEDRYLSSTHVLREVEKELSSLQAKASFNKASKFFIEFFARMVSGL